jgi:hypothetical protein
LDVFEGIHLAEDGGRRRDRGEEEGDNSVLANLCWRRRHIAVVED